jgi:hypothetical protein
MISAEELVGEEQAEWYSLTPMERWRESGKLWDVYFAMGGSLDPEPDPQSPFFDPNDPEAFPVDGRRELRLVIRNGVRTFELISDHDGPQVENHEPSNNLTHRKRY